MQSKYVVLGRISAQIIQRCEPLAANLRMQVVVNDAGAAHNADAMYHLPLQGLLEYFATDYNPSMKLVGFVKPIAPVSCTTDDATAQLLHQRPAAVVYDNSAAIMCHECRMQLNGKCQLANHLKGNKHKRSVRRNLHLTLAPCQHPASPPYTPPTAEAGAEQPTQ